MAGVEKSIENVNKGMVLTADGAKKLAESLGFAVTEFNEFGNSTRAARERLAQVVTSLQKAEAECKKTGKATAEYKEHIKRLKEECRDNEKALASVIKQQKAYDIALEEATRKAERAADKFGTFTKKIGTAKDIIGGLAQTTMKYVTVLGVQTISFEKIVQITTTYNQSLFNLSRSQGLLGRGTNDIVKAFENVRKNTVMSKNDFLAFANSMSKLYVGITPTANAMADFASSLQKAFGPNIDVINQKAGELLQIQGKFPALYDEIIRAQKLMASDNISGANAAIASATAMGQAIGLSTEQLTTMMQFATKTTGEQEKMIDLNKEIAKNAQLSQDAMLAMGKSMEDQLTSVARTANDALKVFEKFAGTITNLTGVAIILGTTLGTLGKMGILKTLGDKILKRQGIAAAAKMATAELPGFLSAGAGTGATAGMGLAAGAGIIAAPATALTAASMYYKKQQDVAQQQQLSTQGYGISSERERRARIKQISASGSEIFTGGALEKFTAGKEELMKEMQAKSIEGVDPSDIAKVYVKKFEQLYENVAKEVLQASSKKSETTKKSYESETKGKSPQQLQKESVSLQQQIVKLKQELQDLDKKAVQYGSIQPELIERSKQKHQQLLEIQNKSMAYINAAQQGWARASANLDNYISLNSKLASDYESMGSMFEQMGVAQKDFFVKSLEATSRVLDNVKNKAEEYYKNVESQRDVIASIMPEFKMPTEGSVFEKVEQVANQLVSLKEKMKDMTDEQRESVNMSIQGSIAQSSIMTGIHKQWIEGVKSYQERVIKAGTTEVEVANRTNALIESRRETERELLSAGLMGMYRDMHALSRVMDTINAQLTEYEKYTKQMPSTLGMALGRGMEKPPVLSEDDVQNLKNASTYAERRSVVEGLMTKHQTGLKRGTEEYESIVGSVLKQMDVWEEKQQKIVALNKKQFDLTKEIREGYLSAFAEASSGAKDFEKILGNQETGWTQILKSIKEATGEYTNTMTRGGMISQSSPFYGSRTEKAAEMKMGGLKTAGGQHFIDQQKTLSNWQDFEKRIDKANRGETSPYKVGGAVVSNIENYVPAFAEAGKQGNKEVVDELKQINETLKNNVPEEIKSRVTVGKTIPTQTPPTAAPNQLIAGGVMPSTVSPMMTQSQEDIDKYNKMLDDQEAYVSQVQQGLAGANASAAEQMQKEMKLKTGAKNDMADETVSDIVSDADTETDTSLGVGRKTAKAINSKLAKFKRGKTGGYIADTAAAASPGGTVAERAAMLASGGKNIGEMARRGRKSMESEFYRQGDIRGIGESGNIKGLGSGGWGLSGGKHGKSLGSEGWGAQSGDKTVNVKVEFVDEAKGVFKQVKDLDNATAATSVGSKS